MLCPRGIPWLHQLHRPSSTQSPSAQQPQRTATAATRRNSRNAPQQPQRTATAATHRNAPQQLQSIAIPQSIAIAATAATAVTAAMHRNSSNAKSDSAAVVNVTGVSSRVTVVTVKFTGVYMRVTVVTVKDTGVNTRAHEHRPLGPSQGTRLSIQSHPLHTCNGPLHKVTGYFDAPA